MCVDTTFQVTKCKELWKSGVDPFRIKHRWHDRSELFWLFNKHISSRTPNSKAVHCAVAKDGKLVRGPCNVAASFFEYTFDVEWGDKQTVSFKTSSGECITADASGVVLKACTADASQLFVASYATDGLVVADPERSSFTEDHGQSWNCCNEKEKRCCNRVTVLRDAEYFVGNSTSPR
jgi:hypothetical protein